MIRLLMATKPRNAPAPDARCVLSLGLPPAWEAGRSAKGSLLLAADQACAKCPEEGTADACACHAVERAAHEGEAPERHERGTTRRVGAHRRCIYFNQYGECRRPGGRVRSTGGGGAASSFVPGVHAHTRESSPHVSGTRDGSEARALASQATHRTMSRWP